MRGTTMKSLLKFPTDTPTLHYMTAEVAIETKLEIIPDRIHPSTKAMYILSWRNSQVSMVVNNINHECFSLDNVLYELKFMLRKKIKKTALWH